MNARKKEPLTIVPAFTIVLVEFLEQNVPLNYDILVAIPTEIGMIWHSGQMGGPSCFY